MTFDMASRSSLRQRDLAKQGQRMQATAIILAAGLGTRMQSSLPKTLHRLAGRSMLRHLLASCEPVFDRIVVVLGPDMAAVEQEAKPHVCVVQHERLGTAHAAKQAVEHFGDGRVAVLYADNPLIRTETLRRLLDSTAPRGLSLLAFRPADPARYGRVLMDEAGLVERIVEHADASPSERAVGLCNAGVLCAGAAQMRGWLDAVRDDNTKQEYYLTDVVALARADGCPVLAVEAPADELAGVNDRGELARAEAVLQGWMREAAMAAGVTMIDPASVFLSADTRLSADVTIEPHVFFGPGVTVAGQVTIRAFSHIEGAVIGAGSVIGPFARLRPGSRLDHDVHVGNFVEIKASHLASGVKASHLTYLGDASVGTGTNIGAGTITCNYDGANKHRTIIGSHAFIGSDVALVAPVSVGDGAIVAAGSVITEDVAADALALARGRQVQKPGRARQMRAAAKKEVI
jgi:bifunctional UDP-N-acetylglucosamine pyrophosphorylase/glucosamine-1-phosphate N-acetyltransferase